MKNRFVYFCFVLCLAFGCSPNSGDSSETPTPFPTSAPIPTTAVSGTGQQARPTTIGEIAAAPEQFENLFVRVSGQFQRFPKLVCSRVTAFQSPVTWGLAGDGFLAQGSGFDAQLRSLVEENLTITVDGVWRRWRGPVGCGKRATTQELWYLEINQIVSPSPLVRVTLTATSEFVAGTAVAAVTTEGTMPPIAVEATATVDPAALPATQPSPALPMATPTQQPTLPSQPTSTPMPTVAEVTSTPTTDAANQATATPEGDVTSDPTATPQPDTTVTEAPNMTNTPTSGNATPTTAVLSTATPSGGGMTNQGEVQPNLISGSMLNSGEIHRWTFEGFEDDPLTVLAIGLEGQDISIALLAPSGNVLAQQNENGIDEPEKIGIIDLTADGAYTIEVSSANSSGTAYHLLVADGGDIEVINFRGELMDGDNPTVMLIDDEDQYWHFIGMQGETVSFVIDPDQDGDPIIYFYGPDGAPVQTPNSSSDGEIDDGDIGESEQLSNFTLPSSGLYSIRVGEFDFLEMEYTISLDIN